MSGDYEPLDGEGDLGDTSPGGVAQAANDAGFVGSTVGRTFEVDMELCRCPTCLKPPHHPYDCYPAGGPS